MLPPTALEWREPLDYLHALPPQGVDFALLYSGMKTPYSGRYSILAIHTERTIEDNNLEEFTRNTSTDKSCYNNVWLGYLGYGLKHVTEHFPPDKPSHIDLPALHMRQYATLLVFDHEQKTLHLHRKNTDSPMPPNPVNAVAAYTSIAISELASDMTKAEYLAAVQQVKEAIAQGTLYQANLTRKFFGHFATPPSPVALFSKLAHISPAPYSALLKWGNVAIISSSPEQFLHLEANGKVETRPIKGSAPRGVTPEADDAIREALATSEKDRAENLMIVDLMRNDLARGCEIGSVKTEALYDISTYATVHHMASTITGQRRADVTPLELVAQCFPPGSMTGAPKIRAIELCSALEPRARGVYSGAIGWFGGDGSADLSVVIRTLVLDGERFEFQVGGAIVHDSTPEGEWEETLVKARGIAAALGVDMEMLREL